MFVWQLFRDRIPLKLAAASATRSTAAAWKNFLSLPSTQRWAVLRPGRGGFRLAVLRLARAVDIATLILIYVMLGIGLNIVVGLAGLLDSATSASTRWCPHLREVLVLPWE